MHSFTQKIELFLLSVSCSVSSQLLVMSGVSSLQIQLLLSGESRDEIQKRPKLDSGFTLVTKSKLGDVLLKWKAKP